MVIEDKVKHLFVTREVAEIMKSFGFDEPCFAIYHRVGGSLVLPRHGPFTTNTVGTRAATWFQAAVWLENQGVDLYFRSKTFTSSIIRKSKSLNRLQ